MTTSALPKTAGANAMGRDIRVFYDLKRQRVLKTKSINEMKISHMPQQPSAFPVAKSLILKFAGISVNPVNVSATFSWRGEGGFYNARSRTLLA